MIANLIASIDLRCAFGFLCAELLCWLYASINQQKPDVLPAPRMDRIARGGKDAWVVSSARDRC